MQGVRYNKIVGLLWLLIGMAGNLFAESLDTWTIRSMTNSPFVSVAYGNGAFVAVGPYAIISSTNGADWITVRKNNFSSYYNVIYANSNFVAVGPRSITYLTNHLNWTDNNLLTPALQQVWSGVAFGNGIYVAVSESGMVLTTTNVNVPWTFYQSNWTNSAQLPGGLFGITYANGKFVAVGGYIFTSINGINWTTNQSPVQYTRRVAYGNGIFVAIGDQLGTVFTSEDAINWVSRRAGSFNQISGIGYGNGAFVAVGNNQPYSSSDGINWTRRIVPPTFPFYAIAYGNGSFVAVGEKIGQAGPIFTLSPSGQVTNGALALKLTGEIGRSYHVQYSPALNGTNWSDLTNFVNDSETTQFLHTEATNFSQYFYRAQTP